MTKNKPLPLSPTTNRGEGIVYSRGDSCGRPGLATGRPGPAGHRRVVTNPEAAPPAAWDDFARRRQQLYAARSQRQTYTRLKPRTLAQTGAPAAYGAGRIVKRLPQQPAPAPIPARSGQRSSRRHGLLWKVLALFALVIMVVLAASFALTSPAFRVAQVTVRGTHNALLMQSIQRMGMQGQNIFLLDAPALTARIDRLPLVASALLEKQWPDQLAVTVRERVPVLLWQAGSGTFAVDNQGVALGLLSEVDVPSSAHLMTVVDTRPCSGSSSAKPLPSHCNTQVIHAGSRINAADIAFALLIFDRLPALTGLSASAFAVHYSGSQFSDSTAGSFTVVSQNGWIANLGGTNDPNPLNNRLLELQQILILAQQQQLNLATIDLRFGLRPVYTLKN